MKILTLILFASSVLMSCEAEEWDENGQQAALVIVELDNDQASELAVDRGADCTAHSECVGGWCVNDECLDSTDCRETVCSGNGECVRSTIFCYCDPGWTGADCSEESADIECEHHGQCSGDGGSWCIYGLCLNSTDCAEEIGCPADHTCCRLEKTFGDDFEPGADPVPGVWCCPN